ncbi:hypothetical protein NOS26_11050 [Megasphaera sp. SC8-1]|nr:hypothetical protein [Megasphaera sp. SC8-1]MCQ4113749.1 hypothetical protein [Megasphaera sp. SC8-1]
MLLGPFLRRFPDVIVENRRGELLDDMAIPFVGTNVYFIAQYLCKAAAGKGSACGCLIPMRVEVSDNVDDSFVGIVHRVDQTNGIGIPGNNLQRFVSSQLVAQGNTAAYPFTL